MATPVEVVCEVNQTVYNEIDKSFQDLEKIEGVGSITEPAKDPVLQGVKMGGAIGVGVGAIYGGVIGGVVSAAMEHKKTAAVLALAAVAWIYREEIGNFVTDAIASDNAGGDAFM